MYEAYAMRCIKILILVASQFTIVPMVFSLAGSGSRELGHQEIAAIYEGEGHTTIIPETLSN